MTNTCLNTLFVQTDGAVVRLDHDTLRVEAEGAKLLQIPLRHLESVVLFEGSTITSQAMGRCATENCQVVFLTRSGRFMFRVVGPTTGNVYLRLAQYQTHNDETKKLRLARSIALGKIRNSRYVLLRGARDSRSGESRSRLSEAASYLAVVLENTSKAQTLNEVRGFEGAAARRYFEAFADLICVDRSQFAFAVRSRRPPRDRMNAAMSFVYTLLVNDVVAALESVGLDPQVGMLHGIRAGRPSLALDLTEELRSCFADRLVLTIVNRRQLQAQHFDIRENMGNSVLLNDAGRRIVLTAYQQRKRDLVAHPLLKSKVPFGYVPHIQALLLSRCLRGDIQDYPPYLHGAS